ncbi:hypothetical protein PPACK8108_LOCUS2540 [Phakopsora pachyrhizi]|uniref:Uncharacterized protein n=1 Tax=Phakopsora pachyrhizi TaxID=170000 RepID=A0AAV0AJW4_PHAPC|nr:hypothetical protein PPACK8108_LOCUS2540 [Phakopsora pachyrhizi]
MIKEAWGMLSSTLDVQTAMMGLEKQPERGKLPEKDEYKEEPARGLSKTIRWAMEVVAARAIVIGHKRKELSSSYVAMEFEDGGSVLRLWTEQPKFLGLPARGSCMIDGGWR